MPRNASAGTFKNRGSANEGARRFEVTLYEDLMTDYVFETDLLVDGPRQRRIIRWSEETDPPADDVTSSAAAVARAPGWTTKGRSVSAFPPAEPIVERHPGCTSVQRIRRELAVSENPDVLWRLIQEMDGAEHDGGDPVPASSRRAAVGCTNGRRAGRHRRHRRFRTSRSAGSSIWPRRRASCRQGVWMATRSCDSRRTGTTARIRKRRGSPSANRFPIAFATSTR